MNESSYLQEMNAFLPSLAEIQNVQRAKASFKRIRRGLQKELLNYATLRNNPFAALISRILNAIESLLTQSVHDGEEFKKAYEQTEVAYKTFKEFLEKLPEGPLDSKTKIKLFDLLTDLPLSLLLLYVENKYYQIEAEKLGPAVNLIVEYLRSENGEKAAKSNMKDLRTLVLEVIQRYPEVLKEDTLVRAFWNSAVQENPRAMDAIFAQLAAQRASLSQR